MATPPSNDFVLRLARPQESAVLADFHYACYSARYFSPDSVDGGLYGKTYPQLRPDDTGRGGEERALFRDYWQGFFDKPVNRCFVVEQRGNIAGFVKGSLQNISNEVRAFTQNEQPTIELGSLYIAPEQQNKGLGRTLTTAFSDLAVRAGAAQMVTRCWAQNTSPRFFRSLGATDMGRCAIDVSYAVYENDKRQVRPAQIEGVMMVWSPRTLRSLKPCA